MFFFELVSESIFDCVKMESLGVIMASLLNSFGLLLSLNLCFDMLFFYDVLSEITLTLGDKVLLPWYTLV